MRVYKVNRIEHTVFDDISEIPSSIKIASNWRSANIGDWVKADDNCYIQILRKGKMVVPKGRNKVREYVGTCTGTFPVTSKAKMDTSRRLNIYSFGGNKSSADVLLDRTVLSKHEHLFVGYIVSGLSPQEAYMKAFPTNSPGYAKQKSAQLVKTKRIMTAMKEELKPILKEIGIDEKAVLENINNIALTSEKDETRLKALFKLSDIMDLEDKNKTTVTQVSGALFQGFADKHLVEAERPKEIGE
ncbi:MAG: hypothetical protein Unbinned1966contig1000_37 [Prokaryotic dsDNA virus sp.]|nr:MAG: hypothetical protein Unbinned1966contig1000_37 [Prokaryotic dsDNA virus sp.]|tara:strand:+ start:5784 stop:6515 length:732 start_codon:yes stop_codon:yes gene_type:complete